MLDCKTLSLLARFTILLISVSNQSYGHEDGYLRIAKEACFAKGEALACVKYKALKLATRAIFGSTNTNETTNETLRANDVISFVPLDEENIAPAPSSDDEQLSRSFSDKRGFASEWVELTKYLLKLFRDFFKTKGLRVNLPEGSRAIEEGSNKAEEGRGRKKKLAVILPFLSLLATLKTKVLLIPILLGVMFIKKIILLAALLLPGLLSTLKACKMHHHASPSHYSHWGTSDTSDFSTGYSNNYAYAGTGPYVKDWASNRAYTQQKPKPTPVYITAPGMVV